MTVLPQHLTPEAMSALVDASAAINSAQDLDETLQAIARAAAAVMKAEASSVIMLDKARGKQVFRAAVGDRCEQIIGMEYDEGAGVSAKAIKTGQALMVNDVSKEKSHYKDIDKLVGFQTRSIIAAPLIHNDEKLGVVEVINPVQSETFDDNDLQIAKVFANLAAIATANAQLCERLRRENRGLKETLSFPKEFVGQSPAIREVQSLIGRVANSSATVLLLGQTGTGKELAARLIHANSSRAERPFIAVNCAALPESLLESELFGHEAGAFTGAVGRRQGRFELADGGTIFLDEIGEIASSIQVKLLRVIQEKEIVRVGGTQTIGCDVRIIAATNRDLSKEMQAGRFRDDLYYRLNVFPIEIPPLRKRREDISLLADHFIRQIAADTKTTPPAIAPDAMATLTSYDFPGNVRELQNILERASLLCCCVEKGDSGEHIIRREHLPRQLIGSDMDSGRASQSVLAANERAMIVTALRENNWNQSRAAAALGVSRDNIRYRVKKYNIKKQ